MRRKLALRTEKALQQIVLEEKARGTPDLEIGRKYGVTYRYIERLITRSQGLNISALRKGPKTLRALQPRDFEEQRTTVWSFRQRGKWATHSGEYRGNWSPYIPRNVILKYSKPGELILDYFCGAGTTAVECKLLERRCIALDINEKAIALAKENLDFNMSSDQLTLLNDEPRNETYEPQVSVGDARDLSGLDDNSIDLICAHPPYANIIQYTDSKEGDLSFCDIDEFLEEMAKVARESFRVLKPGRQCAILIGDTRRRKRVIPLGFKLMNVYLETGFKLKELVIKRQHNCKTTGFWYENSVKYNFLLLAHEYLPIFEKPRARTLLQVKEIQAGYTPVAASAIQLRARRKLAAFETTTVWVLPQNGFEERLDRNVLDRYSNGKGHSVISFVSSSAARRAELVGSQRRNPGLLFIKSPFLAKNPSGKGVALYLHAVSETIARAIRLRMDSGFVVIQTQDVRIDGYVEPLAKRIVAMLAFDNLQLKEIVVVTQDGVREEVTGSSGCLEITHQYLLVYEVRDGQPEV